MRDQAEHILGLLAAQGVRVTGLAADSRSLAARDAFVAYPGARSDGRKFIPAAIARGASAVLWERSGFQWNADWRVPNLPVDDLRGLSGHLANEVYGRPSERLWTMGLTGTNGKTSSSLWLAQACTACGARTALVGTLGTGFPGKLDPGVNTTPDAVSIHRSLARLLDDGAQGVAIEATSIGQIGRAHV